MYQKLTHSISFNFDQMLYRLLLKTSDFQAADIVIDAPYRSALQHLIDDPGEDGYKLTEVLSTLLSETQLLSVQIDSEINSLSPNDTLLQWDYIKGNFVAGI